MTDVREIKIKLANYYHTNIEMPKMKATGYAVYLEVRVAVRHFMYF